MGGLRPAGGPWPCCARVGAGTHPVAAPLLRVGCFSRVGAQNLPPSDGGAFEGGAAPLLRSLSGPAGAL